MPRQARVTGAFSTYHVILRGNERRAIFLCDNDRTKFLGILERVKRKYGCIIEAYCLMDNHIHLLLFDNGHDIARIMKSMNISYAYHFNKTYNRVGHLFQDRFKSELISDDTYLLQVSAYIHQNPVKAGIVDTAKKYPWSSMRAYLSKEQRELDLVNADRILGMFSADSGRAAQAYAEYATAELLTDQSGLSGNAAVGCTEMRNSAFLESWDAAQDFLLKVLVRTNTTLDELRHKKALRSSLIRELRSRSSLTLREIGKLTGGLSASAISKILSKEEIQEPSLGRSR